MKIVSKFKDYYDFAAGYDTDPRKVYVRERQLLDKSREYDTRDMRVTLYQMKSHSVRTKDFYAGIVLFCDNCYGYLHDLEKDIFYYHFKDIPEETIQKFYSQNAEISYLRRAVHEHLFLEKVTTNNGVEFRKRKNSCEFNKMTGDPILYTWLRDGVEEEYVVNGRLADIKFGSVKSPQEAYQELYNWIEFKEPETDSSPTNMSRFESKGFDKKSSFRNIK